MRAGELVLWLSVILLGYTFIGYPLLIWLWAALFPRSSRKAEITPSLSLLIVAHNEAARIAERLVDVLSLDYPRDRLEILLASDGSTDGTVEEARVFEKTGVRIFQFEARRGKPAVLNDLLAIARGEIVVLADARQRFAPRALRELVGHFADPRVGAVSGELIFRDDSDGTAVGSGVGFYWRYEKFLRRTEGLVDSTVGATGAIYAIRRGLFEPIPEDTLVDDLLIPMKIVRKGYRVLFDPAARAYDRSVARGEEEFTRKVRTIAGNFQFFTREPWALNPFHNRLWFQTFSHKGLRLLTPLFLAGMLGANLLALDSQLYQCTLAGQIGFYASALGGYALRHSRRKIRLLTVPYVLCLLSWATVIAFARFITGRQAVTWERASR